MSQNHVDPALLERLPLFAPLDAGQRARVIATTRALSVAEGRQLFSVGRPAEHFYLVVSGLIKLSRVSEGGHEKIVELVNPGRLFAEAILFLPRQYYPVDAAAIEDSFLYAFDNRTYRGLLEESTTLSLALCRELSVRLHELIEEIERLSLQNASLRVVNYLSGLIDDRSDNTAVIDLTASKQVIAARLSITPETFSRILRTLSDQGVISIRGKTVGVADVDRLRALAHPVGRP